MGSTCSPSAPTVKFFVILLSRSVSLACHPNPRGIRTARFMQIHAFVADPQLIPCFGKIIKNESGSDPPNHGESKVIDQTRTSSAGIVTEFDVTAKIVRGPCSWPRENASPGMQSLNDRGTIPRCTCIQYSAPLNSHMFVGSPAYTRT